MKTIYPLIQIITNFTAVSQTFLPWEICAMNLIEKYRPSSVFFSCKSSQHCPNNDLYRSLKVPSQSVFGLETDELPTFEETDMIFWVDNVLITWSNETVLKYRLKGRTNFKIVIVAKVRSNIEDDFQSMKQLFTAMWLSGIVRCAVLLMNDTISQIYTYIPFRDRLSCEDTTPVLLGQSSDGIDDVFDETYKIFNLNKCPLRVAAMDDRPFFYFGLRGIGKLSHLVKEIARKMNATLEAVLPRPEVPGMSCGPKEFTGLRGLAWDGTTHMGVGSFNHQDCSKLEYISLPIVQCLGWCVPVLPASDYVFLFILKQLQPKVWAALITSVVVVSVVVLVLCDLSCERWTSSDAFNLALILYAQPPPVLPRASSIRLIVIIWLLACLVVRTAYEGELKSRSSLLLSYHIIQDLDDLVTYNVKLCSSPSNVQNMMQFENVSLVRTIIQKVKTCKGGYYDNLIKAAKLRDRAVFTSDLRCVAVASELWRQNLYLLPIQSTCFKTFQLTPIVTFPGSPFKHRWGTILLRCTQAGLVEKWLDIKFLQKDAPGARPYTLHHLLPALFVLGVGHSVALLLFICEKTYHRRKKLVLKCKVCVW